MYTDFYKKDKFIKLISTNLTLFYNSLTLTHKIKKLLTVVYNRFFYKQRITVHYPSFIERSFYLYPKAV